MVVLDVLSCSLGCDFVHKNLFVSTYVASGG